VLSVSGQPRRHGDESSRYDSPESPSAIFRILLEVFLADDAGRDASDGVACWVGRTDVESAAGMATVGVLEMSLIITAMTASTTAVTAASIHNMTR
jgi:hypothetical protein